MVHISSDGPPPPAAIWPPGAFMADATMAFMADAAQQTVRDGPTACMVALEFVNRLVPMPCVVWIWPYVAVLMGVCTVWVAFVVYLCRGLGCFV